MVSLTVMLELHVSCRPTYAYLFSNPVTLLWVTHGIALQLC